jgi:hydrogenase expression/formation protein HypD
VFSLRDKELSSKILRQIKNENVSLRFMHVCGTHQDSLMKHGLDSVLKEVGITIIQGPGCPVCVTTPSEIEKMIYLAKKGHIIASFGDMINVPGQNHSLKYLRTEGCDIRTVYSIEDAVSLAERQPDREVIFMAVGFETTTQSTAATILNKPPGNFSILCCHRLIPPALKTIVEMGEIKIDGFIEPGHVATIIGVPPFSFLSTTYHIPQVITGFEPIDLLMASWMLVKQIKNKHPKIQNEYSRAVSYDGNKAAQEMIKKVFDIKDKAWRGFSTIPSSGFKLRNAFEHYDAEKKFTDELKELNKINFSEPEGCRCGELLRGLISPKECPLFGKKCIPSHPVGPCMVSDEGSCHITFKYSTKHQKIKQ